MNIKNLDDKVVLEALEANVSPLMMKKAMCNFLKKLEKIQKV